MTTWVPLLCGAWLAEHCTWPTDWPSMELNDPERRRAAEALTLVTFLRRIVIGLSGGLVLIVGVAMTVLPGPAVVVVPLGLAILATEFAWARRMMHKFRHVSGRIVASVRREKPSRETRTPTWSANAPGHASRGDPVSRQRPSSAAEQHHRLRM